MNEFEYKLKLEEISRLKTKKARSAFVANTLGNVRRSTGLTQKEMAFKLCTKVLETYKENSGIPSNVVNIINWYAGELLQAYYKDKKYDTLDDTFQYSTTNVLPVTPFRFKKLMDNQYIPYSLKYKMLLSIKDI